MSLFQSTESNSLLCASSDAHNGRVGKDAAHVAGVREGNVWHIYSVLSHLEGLYPGFRRWYWRTVVPGLATGERKLFIERRDGTAVAVVIAKATLEERKLCTVWVDSAFAGRGLGRCLMRRAMEWVDTEYPIISVPEERFSLFESTFRRWNFSLVQTLESHYRQDRLEFVFNGPLRPPTSAKPYHLYFERNGHFRQL